DRAGLAAAATPCTDPLVQDYAAWRRALLAIAAVALALTALLGIFTHQSVADGVEGGMVQLLGESTLTLLDFVTWVLLLANAAGAVLVAFAARAWSDLDRSRRLARRGWFVMFLAPLALAALPWTHLLAFDHLPPQPRPA